jgi:hypothetical protein
MLEREIAEIRDEIEMRKKNREKIIDRRLREMSDDDDGLDWW